MNFRNDQLPPLLSLLIFGYLAWPYMGSGRHGPVEPQKASVKANIERPVALESTPPLRDPFMREALVAVADGHGSTSAVARAAAIEAPEKRLRLKGTLLSGELNCAVIGDTVYEIGDTVPCEGSKVRFRVVRIAAGQVVLESLADKREVVVTKDAPTVRRDVAKAEN